MLGFLRREVIYTFCTSQIHTKHAELQVSQTILFWFYQITECSIHQTTVVISVTFALWTLTFNPVHTIEKPLTLL